jgi:hypothetical protein
MQKFWELFQESTIIRGTIALALTVVCLIMFATETPVPQELTAVWMLALGFYYGRATTAQPSSIDKTIVHTLRGRG